MNRLTRTAGDHPYAIGWLGTVVAVFVVLLPILLLISNREAARNSVLELSRKLCSIVVFDLERSNRFYDAQLKSMVTAAEDPRTWKLPADLRARFLFYNLPDDAYVERELLFNAAGKLIASRESDVSSELDVHDRDYFQFLQTNPNAGLYYTRPFYSRINPEQLMVALTRRVNKPDGSFDGIAWYGIRLFLYQRLFDRIDSKIDSQMLILLDDGTVIAKRPYRETDVGTSIANLPVFREISTHDSGWVSGLDSEGVKRLMVYQHVPGAAFPLIALIAPREDDVFADWRRQAIVLMSMSVAFGAVLASGSWVLAFALRDKLLAQRTLMQLASTDPLTGLNNRRTLEERLRFEWERSRRRGDFMSALFIDIDHFKRFNDTYGHATGDEVLKQVASCIVSLARRSEDIVARYGGEEFLVILPGAKNDVALDRAENIRKAVLELRIAHETGDTGVVTVSVGCATTHPVDGGTPDGLIEAADAQLYRAKASGRNQVKSTEMTAFSTS